MDILFCIDYPARQQDRLNLKFILFFYFFFHTTGQKQSFASFHYGLEDQN